MCGQKSTPKITVCELVQIFKQEQEDPGVSIAQLATGAHKIKEE